MLILFSIIDLLEILLNHFCLIIVNKCVLNLLFYKALAGIENDTKNF